MTTNDEYVQALEAERADLQAELESQKLATEAMTEQWLGSQKAHGFAMALMRRELESRYTPDQIVSACIKVEGSTCLLCIDHNEHTFENCSTCRHSEGGTLYNPNNFRLWWDQS